MLACLHPRSLVTRLSVSLIGLHLLCIILYTGLLEQSVSLGTTAFAGFLLCMVSALLGLRILQRELGPLWEITNALGAAHAGSDPAVMLRQGNPEEAEEIVRLREALSETLANRAALEKERMLARLKSALLHDFRGPSREIRELLTGGAGLGSAGLCGGESDVLEKESVSRRAELAAALDVFSVRIENLFLDVMELHADSAPVRSPTHLKSLVTSALDGTLRRFPGLKVHVDHPCAQGDMVLSLDASKVSRALENVLQNALEALQDQSVREPGFVAQLAVEFERAATGGILLHVHDSAADVPQELWAHLFEFGFTSGKAGGTGVGLFSARHVMKEHGGDLAFHPSGSAWNIENRGQCEKNRTKMSGQKRFTFFFPADAEIPGTPPSQEIKSKRVHGTRRVLVLEDNELQKRWWQSTVAKIHHAQVEVLSGMGSLRRRVCSGVGWNEVDCVVCDYISREGTPLDCADALYLRSLVSQRTQLVLYTHFPLDALSKDVVACFDVIFSKQCADDLLSYMFTGIGMHGQAS